MVVCGREPDNHTRDPLHEEELAHLRRAVEEAKEAAAQAKRDLNQALRNLELANMFLRDANEADRTS